MIFPAKNNFYANSLDLNWGLTFASFPEAKWGIVHFHRWVGCWWLCSFSWRSSRGRVLDFGKLWNTSYASNYYSTCVFQLAVYLVPNTMILAYVHDFLFLFGFLCQISSVSPWKTWKWLVTFKTRAPEFKHSWLPIFYFLCDLGLKYRMRAFVTC